VDRQLHNFLHLLSASAGTPPVAYNPTCSPLLYRSIADMTSQKLLAKEPDHRLDAKRLSLTTLYGGAVVGPAGHLWYISLDKWATAMFRPLGVPFLAFKVITDSLVFGGLNIAVFFTILTVSEGGTMTDVRRKLKSDFWPTFLTELAVWPALQWINFAKVPVRNQLLVVNSATVLDSTFLCWCRATDDWLSVVLPGFRPKTQ
jgi:protein Mpv17